MPDRCETESGLEMPSGFTALVNGDKMLHVNLFGSGAVLAGRLQVDEHLYCQ